VIRFLAMARRMVVASILIGGMGCAPVMPLVSEQPVPVDELSPLQGVRDGFLRAPPACVIVLPARTGAGHWIPAQAVDEAVERFLSVRVDRVVAGARRDRLARHLALALDRPRDLGTFAEHTQCRHAMAVTVDGGELAYAVVWAERRLALELNLIRIGAEKGPLWSARAEGARGDGGLPFSPFGAVSAAYRAGKLAGDGDQNRSLLDDLLRRMTATLPDMRGLAVMAGGPSRSFALSSKTGR
jgi:hypothetical protein